MQNKRYPGVSPFTSKQKNIFFGRDKDIKNLYKLITMRNQVLLYSKSGIGKTSLLNAGVLPKLQDKYTLIKIRFFAYDEKNPISPIAKTLNTIQNIVKQNEQTFIDELIENIDYKKTLWYYFKQLQLSDKHKFIIIFDQFEELFSYPKEQVEEFKQELYELTNIDIPNEIKQKISDYEDFDDDKIALLYEELNIKTVFAIRSDRLSLLNQLVDKIPDIQETFYELKPLNEKQTKAAIVQPASSVQDFNTKPFSFSPQALTNIINALTDNGKQNVETTQLQIVCQRIEAIAQAMQNESLKQEIPQITHKDLPEFKDIFLNFYDETVKSIAENDNSSVKASQQTNNKIRKFVEDQLIRNEQRISLYEIICLDYVSKEQLKKLVNKHLLRAERNSTGGFSYELSHDTLIEPILISKKAREEKEKAQEELRVKNEKLRVKSEKAEKERIENEKKRKRQRTIIAIVSVAAVIFIFLFLMSIVSLNMKFKQEKIAIEKTKIAEQKTKEAKNKTKELAEQKIELEEALQKANDAEDIADQKRLEAENKTKELAEKQIELEKALQDATDAEDIAEQKRLEAEIQKNKAEQLANGVMDLLKRSLPDGETDVFAYYMWQADTAFVKGEYDNAIVFWQGAKLLPEGIKQENIICAKIVKADLCIKLLEKAGKLVFEKKLDNALVVYKKLQKQNPTDPIATYRIPAFERLETKTMFNSLKLITIIGTEFMMGSDEGGIDEKPIHKVILSDYQISTYEITNQQYATFLNQYGSDKIKNGIYAGREMIYIHKWGLQSENNIWVPVASYENHPVVNVSWYGAYEFCRFYGLNLPTEAQWEYAALSGSKAISQGGGGQNWAGTNKEDELKDFAWYYINSDSKTHKIGTKKPNKFALYDMSGNIWEWCMDWYAPYESEEQTNPKVVQNGSLRVYRGGSWSYDADRCRVANRYSDNPDSRSDYLGFRAGFSF